MDDIRKRFERQSLLSRLSRHEISVHSSELQPSSSIRTPIPLPRRAHVSDFASTSASLTRPTTISDPNTSSSSSLYSATNARSSTCYKSPNSQSIVSPISQRYPIYVSTESNKSTEHASPPVHGHLRNISARKTGYNGGETQLQRSGRSHIRSQSQTRSHNVRRASAHSRRLSTDSDVSVATETPNDRNGEKDRRHEQQYRGPYQGQRGRSYKNRGQPRNRHYSQQRRSQSQLRQNSDIKNASPKATFTKPIGYKDVENMVKDGEIEAHQIALRLSTESSGFSQRLKSDDLHDGWIQLLLKLMCKLCCDEVSQHLNQVLQTLINADFGWKVLKFLQTSFSKVPLRDKHVAGHVSNCLHLLRGWLLYAQTSSQLSVEVVLPYLKTQIAQHDLGRFNNIEESLAEVCSLLETIQKQPEKKQDRERDFFDQHDEEPPDDFREISIFPTPHDITTLETPFVRTNLIDAAYRNVDHYLDVQFRLLREDFVRPLREGIDEIFTPTFGEKKQRQQGLRVYEDVTIEFPKLSPKGIHYCLHFDAERLKYVQWQNSKRLLYGNLVCLSSDDFERHILFATVTERKPDDLRLGYIEVEFLRADTPNENGANNDRSTNTSLISLDDMKKKYRMVESEAYFEAYRHVLSGLQETRTIPLSQYIVECQPYTRHPEYLRLHGRNAVYDFSCILEEDGRSKAYNVVDTENWPDADELQLDPSQVSALKSALTDELSIIQGPPGTGKTHVGLMIMKMLLANKQSLRPERNIVPSDPILVVCFTNHALDQFLEGIAKFHPNNLIRVGGRCKTKSLERYTLNALRISRRAVRNEENKLTRKMIWEVRNDTNQLISHMERNEAILKASTTSILSLECLCQVIPMHQLDQLRGTKGDESLLTWLGVKRKVYPVPENSYIIQETLDVVAEPLEDMGFQRNHIIQAINSVGITHTQDLLAWLVRNREDVEDIVLPNTDIVCAYLDDLQPPINCDKLVKMKFTELEIKCAWLVCTSIAAGGIVTEDTVKQWIKGKHDVDNDEADKSENIEEEATIMQEQRMIDIEADDDVQSIRVDGKQHNRAKTSFGKITAAKHEEIKVDPDFSELEDGFEYQRHEKRNRRQKLNRQLKMELSKVDAMSWVEAENIADIHSLSSNDKWRLYRYWVNALREKLRLSLSQHASEYNRLTKALAEIRCKEDFEILKKTDVIAMTTTGAAKFRDMIYKLPVKIVVVEEAAEVLEAHIVTSMPQSTQHLILIGDHQQLKPSPTVYELAKRYNLDMSLFERMIKNGIACSRLALQHRMRPRIADLVRPHIYKDLRDHESVLSYENIDGMQRNVFFLSHEQHEQAVKDGRSKVNQHEADFMVGLCRYLLQQGYEPDQITILTAYVGQLFAFKKVFARKISEKVRVTAVDNFQGEENDIILLSLVRSNEEGRIGFLSIENRVCVALSRAKKGLYCIGNFQMLQENSKLWWNILKELKKDELLGDSLPLQCKNHPETIIQVKCLQDFEKVPEGGCGKPCRYRLPCGHVCTLMCHPYDSNHEKFVCRKPTEKTCPHGHVSTVTCSQTLRCKEKVSKFMPVCGHVIEVQCYRKDSDLVCSMPCPKSFPCGHKCPNRCGNPCPDKCTEQVKINADCAHSFKVPCYSKACQVKDCKMNCNEVLKCDHVCRGTCGQCRQGCLHIGCSHPKCGRVLCCGHLCKEKCSSVCPPCQEKCETSCVHSNCPMKCFEPCHLCREKCEWRCRHFTCTKLCSEPCNRPRCNEPCYKLLNCGHQCIGLCGEPCPTLCKICHKEKVTEIFFGDEEKEDARFVQLECGHVFTYEGLDIWMEQDNSTDDSDTNVKLKECPRCKSLIRRSTRYGNIVNKQLNLINEVRKIIAGNPEEVRMNRMNLHTAVKSDVKVKTHYPQKFVGLLSAITLAKSNLALSVVEHRYQTLHEFSSLKEKLEELGGNDQILEMRSKLKKKLEQTVEWLFRERLYFSEQEIEDLKRERQRYKDTLKLIQMTNKISTLPKQILRGRNIDKCLQTIKQLVVPSLSLYTKRKQKDFNVALKKMDKLLPNVVPGLGITHDERKMVLQAVNLSKGHWYQCKNGHVYCIGECGGAMEQTKCPECKETIGGERHKVAAGNQVATVMDGATTSAWDPNTFAIPDDVRQWMMH